MAGIMIPRYDAPQVQTTVVNGPRAQGAPAAAFGAGLGAGLSHLGDVGLTISADMQKEEVQRKAYGLSTTLSDLEQELKYGTPGNNNIEEEEPTSFEGFLSIEGSEALTLKDGYLQDFKERATQAIPQDVPEAVKTQMEKMVNERYYAISTEFNRHAIAQESKATDAATGAMEASVLRNISLNPYDDNRFQLELGTLKHVVDQDVTRKYGENNPEATAIRKSRLELAVNDAYSKRINRILLDDPAKGKQFLDDNTGNGTFTPETVDHYTAILKPLVANQDGINKAFEFIPRLKAGEPVDVLISEMQKGLSSRPEVFKVAEAQLRASEVDIHNGRVQAAQATAGPVQKLMIERGYELTPNELLNNPEYKKLIALGTPEAMALANGYSNEVLREHRQKVTDDRQISTMQRLERKEDRLRNEQGLKEERALEFTRLSLNPDEIAGMSDFQVGQKSIELGKSYGDQLRKMKQKLSSPEVLATVKLENKSFTSLMTQLGITSKSKQTEYYTAVQDYLVAHQKDEKRVFNPEQIRKAVVGAFQDVEVSYRTKDLWGDGYSYGTEKKKRIDVTNPAAIVIPKEDLKEVTGFLSRFNIADTQSNRLKVYDELLTERGITKLKGKR